MADRVVFDDGRRTLRVEGDQAGLIYAQLVTVWNAGHALCHATVRIRYQAADA